METGSQALCVHACEQSCVKPSAIHMICIHTRRWMCGPWALIHTHTYQHTHLHTYSSQSCGPWAQWCGSQSSPGRMSRAKCTRNSCSSLQKRASASACQMSRANCTRNSSSSLQKRASASACPQRVWFQTVCMCVYACACIHIDSWCQPGGGCMLHCFYLLYVSAYIYTYTHRKKEYQRIREYTVQYCPLFSVTSSQPLTWPCYCSHCVAHLVSQWQYARVSK